jgi:homoserine kinase
VTRQVRVCVPATSANLGPGFDCLGLAIDLWNEGLFSLDGEGLKITCSGEGKDIPTDERNLVVQAMRFFCDIRGLPFPRGVTIHCNNQIPVGSGLGSSAAAVLIGIMGAAALHGMELSPEETLTMAARMEGHADNAAAAIYGSLVILAAGKANWLVRRIEIPARQVAIVLPAVNLSTHAARAVLPGEIALSDATYNLGRALLVVEALRSADLELLRQSMDDRLHMPYRLPLIPGALQALQAAYDAGASAVTISGAGPSLIAFTPGSPAKAAEAMGKAFREQGATARIFLLQTTSAGANVKIESEE